MSSQPETAVPPAPPSSTPLRWPPQIKYIIGNEACERFSYYGIRSILALYISQVLFSYLPEGEAKDRATEIIHLFIFANYFTPLLGGWISDKLWGRYYTIFYVSLIYCLGNLTLALGVGSKWGLYVGLGLIALGSGGIKPCVSAFCGDQFKAEQSALLQKAYGLFYWSINFGSFFSFLVIPWLKDKWSYRVAFGVPGVLMLVATLIFWLGRNQYSRVKAPGDPAWFKKVLVIIALGALLYASILGQHFFANLMPGPLAVFCSVLVFVIPTLVLVTLATVRLRHRLAAIQQKEVGGFMVVTWYALTSFWFRKEGQRFWDTAREKFTEKSVDAASTVPPILAVFAPICIFWSLFDQTTSTWVMQGNKMLAVSFGQLAFFQRILPHWAEICVGVGVVALLVLLYLVFTKFGNRAANSAGWVRPVLVIACLPVAGLVGWLCLYLPMAEIGAEQMQSMNPLFVMILVPTMLWLYPRIEKLTGIRVSALRRMGTGMLLAGSAYVIVGLLQTRVDAGLKMSVLWQTVPYFILTTSEVLISTTGLEFAFTQAAAEMKSTIMSFWLLTVAFGNLFVPILTKFKGYLIKGAGEGASASVNPSTFYLYAGLTFGVAIVFVLVATQYKERKLELTSG